jgi:osmotically-inducible protein OsmY
VVISTAESRSTALRHVSDTIQDELMDGKVAQLAKQRLETSPHLALRSIVCGFHEGVLVLRGTVASFFLKQLAQETVRSVSGVRLIENYVEVEL